MPDWEIGVTEGPHAAPEFFTRAGIDELYAASYTVHHNSARTGVRLIGPRPSWAREDGGEAGLHPSNIHDVPYAVGALDFTGDTPIILGPDGPSLGGFVCPAVLASGELWKLGQLRPGDTVRFVPVREADAASLRDRRAAPVLARTGGDGDDGILARREAGSAGSGTPAVVYRRDGDDNVIVEYGDPVLDLGLRMRVHALQEALAAEGPAGVIDLTPGIRSLQVHTDAARLPARSLLPLLQRVEDTLPPAHQMRVPSRTVRLPLSWDDPATRLAIERYMHGVRSDAPWTPWNIEFIRRVNGLATPEDVREIVFAARYLVLGLGDVYLGAPVATPVDPRHRLVTTKYNPARTWTAENSVGIGGAYLCIYGMEGPGGYQFVGRTTQVWNRYRRAGLFAEQPWALRFFDRIEWYPVSAEELLDLRAETEAGRGHVDVTEGEFDYGSYTRFLAANAASIAAFRARQSAAFAAEKERWRASGELDRAEFTSAGPEPDASGGSARTTPGGGRGASPRGGHRGDRAVHRERLAGGRPARHAGSQGRQARGTGGHEDGDDHRRAARRDRGGGLHRRRYPGRGGPGAAGARPGQARPGRPWPGRARTSASPVSAVARVTAAYAAIDAAGRPEVWITLRPAAEALAEAAAVDAAVAAGEQLPLAGLVAAVKDNIDVAGLPTTAGAPSYEYLPARDATAVARLRGAGAVVIGKTNLDQFATGLVGTRSPYGAVRNAWDPAKISGGSSSGSAVAVALGLVDFALGTDTAGSGRVPAALNGIVGLKPTRGVIPCTGVVPACRSLDCVTVFARIRGPGRAGGRGHGGPRRRGPAGDAARQPASRRLAVPRRRAAPRRRRRPGPGPPRRPAAVPARRPGRRLGGGVRRGGRAAPGGRRRDRPRRHRPHA